MDDDSPVSGAGAALARKLGPLPLWAWGVVAGLLLFLLSRARGGGRAASPSVLSVEEGQARGYLAEEQARRAKTQGALDDLALGQAKQEFDLSKQLGDLQGYRIQREIQAEKALLEREKTAKLQCPPGQGSVKKDPTTGRLYCRPKARKGNTVTDALGYAERAVDIYAKAQGAR